DVSPDHTTVVFSAGVGPRDLYTVPIDGSAPPVRFAGDPQYEDIGPRFVAGGRQISWTQTEDADPPHGGGLMIANADGTHVPAPARSPAASAARSWRCRCACRARSARTRPPRRWCCSSG